MPSVKEIYSRISDVTIDADSINLNTDTVESLLSTVQADIALVKTDIANGVLSDVRDGTGSAITSTVSGAKRSLDVTAINQSLTTGTGTASGTSSVGTDLIASTDVSGFAEASIQFTGAWPVGATVTPQVSNDNSTWVATTAQPITGLSPAVSNGFTSTNFGLNRVVFLGARYFRLRVTGAGSSGTYDFAYTFNPRTTTASSQSVVVTSAPTTAVQLSTTTSFGYSTYHTAISAATTNATNVKAGSAVIPVIRLTNTSSTIRYFKIFNLSVAPTMGTSTPVLNHAIEPNSSQNIDFGTHPLRLATGFSYAITGGQALLDTTAVGAGDVVVNVAYL
jgi:hypothetical protein